MSHPGQGYFDTAVRTIYKQGKTGSYLRLVNEDGEVCNLGACVDPSLRRTSDQQLLIDFLTPIRRVLPWFEVAHDRAAHSGGSLDVYYREMKRWAQSIIGLDLTVLEECEAERQKKDSLPCPLCDGAGVVSVNVSASPQTEGVEV